MATDVSSPFAFIRTDVRRQLELSREMVDELREINAVIDRLKVLGGAPDVIEGLERRRDKLLLIAKQLANNATETSSTATTVITDVTSKST